MQKKAQTPSITTPTPQPKAVDRLLAAMRFAKVKPYIPQGGRLLDVGAGDGGHVFSIPSVPYRDSSVYMLKP